jgi:hypothetical protein
VIAVPDDGRRLSEGLVVEASVVARLFRIRLLVVDARLVVTPARVKDGRRAAAGLSDVLAPRTRPRRIGAGLAAAEQCLGEGAASLARSRT